MTTLGRYVLWALLAVDVALFVGGWVWVRFFRWSSRPRPWHRSGSRGG